MQPFMGEPFSPGLGWLKSLALASPRRGKKKASFLLTGCGNFYPFSSRRGCREAGRGGGGGGTRSLNLFVPFTSLFVYLFFLGELGIC